MSYETDFYAWTNEQAALLRAGRLSGADLVHIAEELESMGRSEKRELESRLVVLLAHLLKWQYQPDRRGASWEATITLQRVEVPEHLADNPSLKTKLPDLLVSAYAKAIIVAAGETALPISVFPTTCPWAYETIINREFWPNCVPVGSSSAPKMSINL